MRRAAEAEIRTGRKRARAAKSRDASHVGTRLYRKRLDVWLGRADDEAVVQLIWAVDALQNERPNVANRYIRYPDAAVNAKIGSAYYIPPWDLETLFSELMRAPKAILREGPNTTLNATEFVALAALVKNLRNLENAESGIVLRRMSVLWELPRIAYRQFPWQRGFFNAIQVYRWHYLFGGPRCQRYFEAQYGLSISDFALVGFALYSHFDDRPWQGLNLQLPEVGITTALANAALKLLAISHEEARQRAVECGRPYGVAYQASILRRTPIVRFQGRLRCPLRDRLMTRTTVDVFYDLVGGPSDLRNEISARFESYSLSLLQKTLPLREVTASYRYGSKARLFESPDVLLCTAGAVILAIECKSTKMSFDAQFSEDPLRDAERGFDELAKGVFQLWRFFSHARRGLNGERLVSPEARALVLTLDSWLTASNDFRLDILRRAQEMSASQDLEILPEDMKPVVFCPIDELEMTLLAASDESFFGALDAATGKKYEGWSLEAVHRDLGSIHHNPYPFRDRLGEVLPWWNRLEELAKKRTLVSQKNPAG